MKKTNSPPSKHAILAPLGDLHDMHRTWKSNAPTETGRGCRFSVSSNVRKQQHAGMKQTKASYGYRIPR
jgi:hypothetical protein